MFMKDIIETLGRFININITSSELDMYYNCHSVQVPTNL